eukprot:3638008-Alexandrium_andersonii.AAC.1
MLLNQPASQPPPAPQAPNVTLCLAGKSCKSLKLYSNEQWIGQLYRPIPAGIVWEDKEVFSRYHNSQGKNKVSGGRTLKQSQAYPLQFGLK